MEHSEELRDLTLRFYKASATGDLSFFDRHVSRQEGAQFIGTDSNEWWEALEALREAARTHSEAIEGGGLQIVGGQPQAYRGASELLIEQDGEFVKSYPRPKPRSHPTQLGGPLPPQTESVEQLIVDALHDLTDAGHPAPQALGPYLAGVAFGRADEPRSIVIKPPEVVFGAFEALVDHIRPQGRRTRAPYPGVRPSPHGEESLGHLLIGGGGGAKAETRHHSRRIDGGEQAKALVPSQTVGPPDVGVARQPSRTPSLGVPDGHRRAIESFVRTLSYSQKRHQVRDEVLDEPYVGTHQPVELRAIWQGREGLPQTAPCIAVEVPFTSEAVPPGEDGQGCHLALGEGCLRAGPPFWRVGLAEVVDHNVKCGEEGVHVDHESPVPFPSGSGSKPTLNRGHLPLDFRPDNSHQAFEFLKLDEMGETVRKWTERWGRIGITARGFVFGVVGTFLVRAAL